MVWEIKSRNYHNWPKNIEMGLLVMCSQLPTGPIQIQQKRKFNWFQLNLLKSI